jgi:hypothetical protein
MARGIREDSGMAKLKLDPKLQARIDKEYPSRTLYTSPPASRALKRVGS